jgi:threonine dehydrogenase-like Zn-dependent dehydrogenase
MRAIVLELNFLKVGLTMFLSKFSKSAYYGPLSIVKYRRDYPEPKLPSEDWVKLKTRICGICGSDVRLITLSESTYLYPMTSFPLIPGHEIVATVEETGKNVGDFQRGERVVVVPALPCRVRGFEECEFCRMGRFALCKNTDRGTISPGIFVGICRDVPGGWAEYTIAHHDALIRVPDEIPDENAVFAEPLTVGIHTALRAFPEEDDIVAVVGCGMIGLATIAALRHLGFRGEIWGIERNERLSEIAKNFGASRVIVGDPISEIAELTGGRVYRPPMTGKVLVGGGVDIAYECVGTAESLDTCLRIAKPLGKVVVAGTVSKVPIDLAPIFAKELEVLGIFGASYEKVGGEIKNPYEIAFDMMRKRDFSCLLTHTFPLEEYRKALWTVLNKRKSGAIKVAFRP